MKGWGGKHPDRMCMVKEEDPRAGSSSVGGPGKTAEVQGVVLADSPPVLTPASLVISRFCSWLLPCCVLRVACGVIPRGQGFYLVKPATLFLQLPGS